jgi:peroxiredoxin
METSVDGVRAWYEGLGLDYTLLADQDHRVAESYGLFDARTQVLLKVATLVIDVDGRIHWRSVVALPTAETIIEHLPKPAASEAETNEGAENG